LKLLTANLRKLQQLSWSERWLLLQAFLILPLVALGVRGFGLRPVHTFLANLRPLDQTLDEDSGKLLLPRAGAIARMVKIAARHGPWRPKCLTQSLALWWFLRRQKIDGDLRIGVQPNGDQLEAHAWVTFQGVVLNDGDDVHQRYAPFSKPIIPGGR
jgi:Transglutaminase-like superfamily